MDRQKKEAELTRLLYSYDCRMDFPQRCHLRTPTPVLKIFKREAEDIDRQWLWQISAVLHVQLESVFLQLCLYVLASTAVLAVHRSLDHYSRSIFVSYFGNLQVNIAIAGVDGRIF